jgi:hypothetical protein
MKPLVVASLLALVAFPAAAVEKVEMPSGATDLHFTFNPGECATIRIHQYGGDGVTISSLDKCTQSHFDIDFTYNDPPDGFYIFPVFEAGSPETVGRKTVLIKVAYWTKGGVFYQSIWTDGRDRVAIIPEPSSWALMILGFGAAGAALRRRGAALTAPSEA